MQSSPATSAIVVIGAGLAGARTVAALRAAGHRGPLTVLGAEGIAPYDRPPLSKELYARPEPAWLSDELGIDLAALADDVRLGEPATALTHTGPHWQVSTARDVLAADHVVLAVGARPVHPWPGTEVLHTAADAARLRPLLVGSRLVVVGAGWIGAEIAGVAAGSGARVTVIEAGAVPLGRQLGQAVGRHLAPWYDAAGVELRAESGVATVTRDGPGRIVHLVDGTALAADVVLAAVGARPATDWLRGHVPLDAAGAVPTDAAGRVLNADGSRGLAGLWAVGDCATRAHPTFGLVPGGHWSAALHDPEPTAAALLDPSADAPADTPRHEGSAPVPRRASVKAPYVFSQQLGHNLALFGLPGTGDEVHFRGDPAQPDGWLALYLDDRNGHGADEAGLVRAILCVGSPREVGAARRLLAAGPTWLNLATALDPEVPLRGAALRS